MVFVKVKSCVARLFGKSLLQRGKFAHGISNKESKSGMYKKWTIFHEKVIHEKARQSIILLCMFMKLL